MHTMNNQRPPPPVELSNGSETIVTFPIGTFPIRTCLITESSKLENLGEQLVRSAVADRDAGCPIDPVSQLDRIKELRHCNETVKKYECLGNLRNSKNEETIRLIDTEFAERHWLSLSQLKAGTTKSLTVSAENREAIPYEAGDECEDSIRGDGTYTREKQSHNQFTEEKLQQAFTSLFRRENLASTTEQKNNPNQSVEIVGNENPASRHEADTASRSRSRSRSGRAGRAADVHPVNLKKRCVDDRKPQLNKKPRVQGGGSGI